jgi:L-ascorbate metabolism protein UlaG (beta-lactamase superfamily)
MSWGEITSAWRRYGCARQRTNARLRQASPSVWPPSYPLVVPVYTNLDGTTPENGVSALFKWKVTDRLVGRGKRAAGAPFVTPRSANDGGMLASMSPRLTWIGHATFVQRLGGKLLATDPVWSRRIQTIPRLAAPGVELDSCPPLDVVTVSHAHYDHLDLPTLRRIGKNTLYVVPKDNAEVLQSAGLTKVVELGWWESHRIGDLRITLVPAQHWSMRMPWDKNRRLWGGFVYESAEGTSYHAGDTAFSADVFRAIGKRFPAIDWAMLPIGAYDPEWFMQAHHMNPEEAGRAFELLGAKNLVAMHWGTFKLTDEPLGEPPERMRAWWADRSLPADRLWVMDLGESRDLVRST